jgi:hypothetical protein
VITETERFVSAALHQDATEAGPRRGMQHDCQSDPPIGHRFGRKDNTRSVTAVLSVLKIGETSMHLRCGSGQATDLASSDHAPTRCGRYHPRPPTLRAVIFSWRPTVPLTLHPSVWRCCAGCHRLRWWRARCHHLHERHDALNHGARCAGSAVGHALATDALGAGAGLHATHPRQEIRPRVGHPRQEVRPRVRHPRIARTWCAAAGHAGTGSASNAGRGRGAGRARRRGLVQGTGQARELRARVAGVAAGRRHARGARRARRGLHFLRGHEK